MRKIIFLIPFVLYFFGIYYFGGHEPSKPAVNQVHKDKKENSTEPFSYTSTMGMKGEKGKASLMYIGRESVINEDIAVEDVATDKDAWIPWPINK